MEDVAAWKEQQLEEIDNLRDEIRKWQTDLKKGTKAWRDEIIQESRNWKGEILGELESLKGEVKYGYKGSAGKGTSSKDLLGPSTGESDQAEADNAPGRKRRGSSSGSN